MNANEQIEARSIQTILSQRTPKSWPEQPPPRCWCNGTGGADQRAAIQADGNNVLVFLRTCVCDKGREEELRTIQYVGTLAERENRHRVAVLWEQAEIPARFREWRLDTSPNTSIAGRLRYPVSPADDSTEEQWDAWLEQLHVWEGSWFLWGNYGTGKTGLAIGYIHEFINNEPESPTALFRSLPDLLSELRSTYGRADGPTEMDLLSKYAHVGLLVLDDLGAEQVSGTGWLQDRLYQIIGKRHSEMRPIFFTSNLSIPKLAERLGERLTWRIIEMCGESHIVEVKGPNQRDSKRAKAAESKSA